MMALVEWINSLAQGVAKQVGQRFKIPTFYACLTAYKPPRTTHVERRFPGISVSICSIWGDVMRVVWFQKPPNSRSSNVSLIQCIEMIFYFGFLQVHIDHHLYFLYSFVKAFYHVVQILLMVAFNLNLCLKLVLITIQLHSVESLTAKSIKLEELFKPQDDQTHNIPPHKAQ